MRLLATLAAAGTLLLAVALPAAAQAVEEIAEQVDFRGYYVEPGLDLSVDDLEELVDRYPEVGFVALDATPPEGADVVADEVIEAGVERGTVVVLTADEAGAASTVYDDAVLDAAFDAAFEDTGDSYETDFGEVAAALSTGVPTPAEPGGEAAGGGISFGWVLVLLVVGVTGFFLWRSSRIDEKAVGRRLSSARSEIENQMAVLANQILELADHSEVADHPQAREHFRAGSEIYQEAERRLKTATTWAELEQLSDDLDRARWELAAAAAAAEGREAPPKPEEAIPEPCFFDPTHGAGVEVAQLNTPAGARNVLVCAEDAAKLRRGERPEPRTIEVGGRRIPAPQAPRTYGGRGFDWLDAFSILVGGMGNPMGYRWGRPRRYRRGSFGMPFPGGFGGGGSRSRGMASRPRGGGSIGRARRGR